MPSTRAALDALAADLRRVFGARLQALVAYGDPSAADGWHTLALVDDIEFRDLAACVPLADRWRRAGLAEPLILSRHEFLRTLDVFPLEYGDIIAHHTVIDGGDPFEGVAVAEADLRRACELHAKSHLIHLREGFLESGGHAPAVSRLIGHSAAAFQTLLANVERLDPGAVSRAGIPDDLVREVATAAESTIADPTALLSRYITAVERLWQQVDGWRA